MKGKIKYIVFSILVILLICLIYLIESGKIIPFDDAVYSLIAGKITEEKTRFFQFISNMACTQCIVLLCLASLIFIKNIKTGILISVNSINSVIINLVFKRIIRRERPSGHAMAAMSFYGFLIYLIAKSKFNIYTKVIYIFLLSTIILLVGISRIYLGVHYASDIIGGYLTSIIYMFIYIFVVDKIKKKTKTV